MALHESERIKTKLLALNIRLHELRMERERTQLHLVQLDRQIEDTRLARLLGESQADPHALDDEVKETRLRLESQEAVIRHVRKSQGETQVRYMLARRREQIQANAEAGSAPDEASG